MRTHIIIGALAFSAIALPSAALADDPNDPEMQNAEAVALDRAKVRQLNQDMLAQVSDRTIAAQIM